MDVLSEMISGGVMSAIPGADAHTVTASELGVQPAAEELQNVVAGDQPVLNVQHDGDGHIPVVPAPGGWRAVFQRFEAKIETPAGKFMWNVLRLAALIAMIAAVIYVLIFHFAIRHHGNHMWNVAAANSSGEGTMSVLRAIKYNADHAPVMSHPVQSQLHHDVVRVLRAAQYKAFAAMLDNVTEPVVRHGVTVFAPSDGALTDFQTTAELRLEDFVRFHVVTDIMPFSNLLRLEVGSRLTTDLSNITILVTNSTADAYQVDDAVIVNPDLYTDATIAVHGINATFNTSKIIEDQENDEPVNGSGGISEGVLPFPSHSRAFKTPNIAVKGVPIIPILMSFSGLFLIYLTVTKT